MLRVVGVWEDLVGGIRSSYARVERYFSVSLTPTTFYVYDYLMERILDIYDDAGRTLIDTELPSWVRSAPLLSKEAADRLPDDLFALVLLGPNGTRMRKFACTDKAGTFISSVYLAAHYPDLPPDGVKVAALNLIRASEVYGLPSDPILEKLAEGQMCPKGVGEVAEPTEAKGDPEGKTLHVETPAQVMMDVDLKSGKATLSDEPTEEALNQLSEALTRHHKKDDPSIPKNDPNYDGEKQADLTGTEVMPIGAKKKKVDDLVRKLASVGNEVPDGPSVRMLRPDLFGIEKKAYVVVGIPLETLEDMGDAEQAFIKKARWLRPEERVKISEAAGKRFEDIGLPVPVEFRKYASGIYRNAEQLTAGLLERENLARFVGFEADYSSMATERRRSTARQYAEKLASLDRRYKLDRFWDGRIENPWLATYALEKRAVVVCADHGLVVTDHQLKEMATTRKGELEKVLEADVVEEFVRNPEQVFSSLPVPLRKVIGRLAMDAESAAKM